jgi:predicted GNAT family N-acyltransferase
MDVKIAQDKKTLLDHFYVRGMVFIEEQAIDWIEEFDAWDYDAALFVLYDQGEPIGAARLYKDKVGRVAVLKAHRHKKAGTVIMTALEDYAKTKGLKTLKLGAQCYIIPFYESLGYEAYGEVFLDALIEHRMMKKDL